MKQNYQVVPPCQRSALHLVTRVFAECTGKGAHLREGEQAEQSENSIQALLIEDHVLQQSRHISALCSSP